MTKRAELRAALSRAVRIALFGAGPACAVVACSGATDVVGVVDDTAAAADLASGGGDAPPAPEAEGDAAVAVVIGRPVLGWQGRVHDWPLAEPLREVFASRDDPGGSDRAERGGPLPALPGRDGAASRSRATALGGERQLPQDFWSATFMDTARSAVLRGVPAERVLDFFAGLPMAVVVAQDGAGDEYLVALEGSAFEDSRCDVLGRADADRGAFRAADSLTCESGWSR